MNEVMLALGDYRFSIETAAYEDLVRTRSWDWTEQPLIGGFPSMQLTGKSAPAITLAGVIYPEYKGGYEQIGLMTLEADKGVALDLVAFTNDEAGVSLGQWVITGLTDRQGVFRANGAPRRIEFTLSIKRYAE